MANVGTNGGNAGASELGVALSGSDQATVAREGGIALAQNATLKTGTDVQQNSGTINVGEQGLGRTFADAITAITEQNTAALSSIVRSTPTTTTTPGPAIPEPTPATDSTTTDAETKKKYWLIGGLVAAVLAVLFFINRK